MDSELATPENEKEEEARYIIAKGLNISTQSPIKAAKQAKCPIICDCSICNNERLERKMAISYNFPNSSESESKKLESEYKGERANFCWLLQHMAHPHFKIKGVPIMIPETAVFHGGKPKFVTRMHRDNTFTILTQGKMLNLAEIMKAIMRSSRQRKKQLQNNSITTTTIGIRTSRRRKSSIFGEDSVELTGRIDSNEGDIRKSLISGEHELKRMNTNSSGGMRSRSLAPVFPVSIPHDNIKLGNSREGGISPKSKRSTLEVAILRYHNDSVRILSESEFMKIMMERSGSKMWRKVSYIQLCLNSTTTPTSGKTIEFYAPVDPNNINTPINYRLNQFLPDSELKINNINMFCVKHCYKIAYYVQKVYNYEILKMTANFAIDSKNNVWFVYAKDINIRHASQLQKKRISFLNEETKEALVHELETYSQGNKKNEKVQKLYNIMKSDFQQIKQAVGVDDLAHGKEEYYLDIDDAFQHLRPNSPFKLSEMLQPTFNPTPKLHQIAKNEEKGECIMKEISEMKSSEELVSTIMSDNNFLSGSNTGRPKRPKSTKSRDPNAVKSLLISRYKHHFQMNPPQSPKVDEYLLRPQTQGGQQRGSGHWSHSQIANNSMSYISNAQGTPNNPNKSYISHVSPPRRAPQPYIFIRKNNFIKILRGGVNKSDIESYNRFSKATLRRWESTHDNNNLNDQSMEAVSTKQLFLDNCITPLKGIGSSSRLRSQSAKHINYRGRGIGNENWGSGMLQARQNTAKYNPHYKSNISRDTIT